jgi:hypothetical protein
MTGPYIDFLRDFEVAATAGRHCQAWMFEFLAACLRGDPMAIERARLRVLFSFEAQLDAMSASMTRNAHEYVPDRPVFLRPDDFQQGSGERS